MLDLSIVTVGGCGPVDASRKGDVHLIANLMDFVAALSEHTKDPDRFRSLLGRDGASRILPLYLQLIDVEHSAVAYLAVIADFIMEPSSAEPSDDRHASYVREVLVSARSDLCHEVDNLGAILGGLAMYELWLFRGGPARNLEDRKKLEGLWLELLDEATRHSPSTDFDRDDIAAIAHRYRYLGGEKKWFDECLVSMSRI
jgi:hypothetical protein